VLALLRERIYAALDSGGWTRYGWVMVPARIGFQVLLALARIGRVGLYKWRLFLARLNSLGFRLMELGQSYAETPALVRMLMPQPARGPLPPLQRHVVMLVVSDVRVDPRVQKAARAAVEQGFRVTVVAPSHRRAMPAPATPDWGPGIAFEFPEVRKAALPNHHYPYLVDSDFLRFARRFRNVIFHGHDLNTACMALQLARETGSACVADFHEWFSENVEWSAREQAYVRNRWFKRMVMRRAERLCMRHCHAVITVCDSIANELQAMQRREDGVHVVRNIPDLSPPDPSLRVPDVRQQVSARPDEFILLWQGGVGPSRLLEPIIQSLAHAPGVLLVVRGPGLEDGSPFRQHYQREAQAAGVLDRLRLLPPVPSRLVVAAAAGADAGIWTLPNLSKNFYYALPNKIFEYLAAGLPVLVADFPEAGGLVRRYDVGFAFDPYSPTSIAAALNRLKAEPDVRRRMAANTGAAMADMDAAREWSRVPALYHSLLRRGTPA
jgi:glycosyltransferase involved in cell wall biosynthesis